MIEMPDQSKTWEYENNFYLSCDKSRLSKVFAQYELFKMISGLPGAVVECGVFKGASLARFAMMRSLFGGDTSRRIIAFDAFGRFPETAFADDIAWRRMFVDTAGEEGVSVGQMREILARKGCGDNVTLVEGDITKTLPQYCAEHPELRVALVNLDTDIHEPAVVVLDHLWPRLVSGGVMILDDYGVVPGETKAVDEYFAGSGMRIRKFDFAATPSFIVKP